MNRRILLSIFLVIFTATTCVSHGPSSSYSFLSNNPNIIYKTKKCDPQKGFPQMVMIPFFENATQVLTSCDVYPSYKVYLALTVFYHQWVENFGDRDLRVRRLLEKVMIQWGNKKKISSKGFSLDGSPFVNRVIIGRVIGPSVIWVYEGHDHKISETALVHELVHISIRATQGQHGDPDHEGNKYEGWTFFHSKLIRNTNQMLRALGI